MTDTISTSTVSACILVLCAVTGIMLNPYVASASDSDFRVPPYVQNPAPEAMTIMWFSAQGQPGTATCQDNSGTEMSMTSEPILAEDLAYPDWENTTFFSGHEPAPPYRHCVRFTGLTPDTNYDYTVQQGLSQFSASFRTAPGTERAIRFMVYADSETEPESTGKNAAWADPSGAEPARVYPIDQTLGYANNLEVIMSRHPDFVVIAGDLVQHGGEQRDWDEFWRHITNTDGTLSLAAHVPYFGSLGNHEYYEGSSLGQYDQPGSERAVARYRTYFEYPPNGASDSKQEKRYYRIDYGPVTLITIDAANDSPNKSENDTNYFLLGEKDANGGHAPAFHPGSRQYAWLDQQLKDTQQNSRFTFVVFHHIPYSVGPHGWPTGEGDDQDTQSGRPTRALTQLFMKYGVDAVLCGHDEMLERSEISGEETGPDGKTTPHTIQFYDAGIGGDGLRGPEEGLVNPYEQFLAHKDSPEIWENGVLVDGGKHYGHLEINVQRNKEGQWEAVISPVYVFPLIDAGGAYKGYERRVYDDTIILISNTPDNPTKVGKADNLPEPALTVSNVPNPFNPQTTVEYSLPSNGRTLLTVYNLAGQKVRTLVDRHVESGGHSVVWDGTDDTGRAVSTGLYLTRLSSGDMTVMGKMVLLK